MKWNAVCWATFVSNVGVDRTGRLGGVGLGCEATNTSIIIKGVEISHDDLDPAFKMKLKLN